VEERKKANKVENAAERASLYSRKVYPYLEKIRDHIDRLELTVDNEIWPLPKYRELLFVK
jgi:glutamine synthetase